MKRIASLALAGGLLALALTASPAAAPKAGTCGEDAVEGGCTP